MDNITIKHGHRFKDLTGQKFGKLIVLEFSHAGKKNRSHWKCLCDCGNIKIISSGGLISKRTLSCGCYHKEQTAKINRKFPGEASWNEYYLVYKRSAKLRNLEFSLTKEQFKEICTRDCYYSGHEPKKVNKIKSNKMTEEGKARQWIFANGIDRIDNKKGYVLNNIVPCCSNCNQMKTQRTKEAFIKHIKETHQHLVKIGEIT